MREANAQYPGSATIWQLAQVREGALRSVKLYHRGAAHISMWVSKVGDNCNVPNYALVLCPGSFGRWRVRRPAVAFINDMFPRMIIIDGSLKSASDRKSKGATVRSGAAIGARSVVLAGVEVWGIDPGRCGLDGYQHVAPHALVRGVPAKQVAWVGEMDRR